MAHLLRLFKLTTEDRPGEFICVGTQRVSLWLVRNLRARRYILRLRPDGSARVTIPRGGSVLEARRFVERQQRWLERQLQAHARRAKTPGEWKIGTEILFRGERVQIEADADGQGALLRLGREIIRIQGSDSDLRPAIEKQMRRLAGAELPGRVFEYSALHQLTVGKVVVRNQRSRWGSCSRRGTISLNWRLIQTPPFVRDYIVLHELMHLRVMNHSVRFWTEVERACPEYETAERWLKDHAMLIR